MKNAVIDSPRPANIHIDRHPDNDLLVVELSISARHNRRLTGVS